MIVDKLFAYMSSNGIPTQQLDMCLGSFLDLAWCKGCWTLGSQWCSGSGITFFYGISSYFRNNWWTCQKTWTGQQRRESCGSRTKSWENISTLSYSRMKEVWKSYSKLFDSFFLMPVIIMRLHQIWLLGGERDQISHGDECNKFYLLIMFDCLSITFWNGRLGSGGVVGCMDGWTHTSYKFTH